jgi:hypothetical protein
MTREEIKASITQEPLYLFGSEGAGHYVAIWRFGTSRWVVGGRDERGNWGQRFRGVNAAIDLAIETRDQLEA